MSTLVDVKAMAKILSVKPSWIYVNIQKRKGDQWLSPWGWITCALD